MDRDLQRVMDRIIIADTGCWLWALKLEKNGYAKWTVDGRGEVAHRAVYQRLVGPIAAGLELDHLCRVTHCVHPLHLEPVTHRENMLRSQNFSALNAMKTQCVNQHEFTPANTIIQQRPGRLPRRQCRTCLKDASRRYEKVRPPRQKVG